MTISGITLEKDDKGAGGKKVIGMASPMDLSWQKEIHTYVYLYTHADKHNMT